MKLINYIRHFLLPVRCPFCNRVISIDQCCCPKCREKLPSSYIESFAYGGYRCVSSFPYDGIFRKAILVYKFHDKPDRKRQLAMLMEKDIKDCYKDKNFDIITSVPLHKNKYKKRGYNQSCLLGKELSALLNIPYVEVLEKHRDNKIQHTLKRKDRIKNVKNAYRLIDSKLIKGKNILIVDDIITTGSTLGECCRILENGGAKEVSCCTFCNATST